MNTTHTYTSTRRRLITAATVLDTASAIAASGSVSALTADARPPVPRPPVPGVPEEPTVSVDSVPGYVAIAYASNSGTWAIVGAPGSSDAARSAALAACRSAYDGRGNCQPAGYAVNGCLALAVGEDNAVALNRWQTRGGTGVTAMSAMTLALDANGGGRIAIKGCASPNPRWSTYTGRVGTMPF